MGQRRGRPMDNGTLYALLYVEINLVAVILVGIIGVKANGMSKMVAQRNFTMSIGAEILFFFSDTLYVMSVNGVIPQSGAFTMVMKTIYFFLDYTMGLETHMKRRRTIKKQLSMP